MKFGLPEFLDLQKSKDARHYYKLSNDEVVEQDYFRHLGGRIDKVYLKFKCEPADHMTLEVQDLWPKNLRPEDIKAYESAIAEAIFDSLYRWIYPRTGCSIKLVELRHDEVGSSWACYFLATVAAMKDLEKCSWEIVDRPIF